MRLRSPLIAACSLALLALFIPHANAVQGAFTLKSPVVTEAGALPAAYTCDGAGSTLPLKWTNPPKGTKSYALVMHHVPPEGVAHWYWVAWDIPSTTTQLAVNAKNFGKLGGNSVNRNIGYTPPCSKGPGDKTYTYTLYALSKSAGLGSTSTATVSRDTLLAAIAPITLGKAVLNVTYSRPSSAATDTQSSSAPAPRS
ncbi:unannotated protein [freshwater metagenome]|uniref:Unannotated protein n=1 Tax=freshwater metagenome TaxID=449393 RepID=A0A6J7CSB7_9ZZZZ